MPPETRYYTQDENGPTGPHSLDVLKQRAEVHAITPDSRVAPEASPDAWGALREHTELHAFLFPSRPRYTLAQRAIERVNTPDETHVAPSVQDMLLANRERQREAEGELLAPQPPRPNNRRRDFLLLAGLINGLVLTNILLGRPWYDPFLVAFFVMGNISVAWVLYAVMDRY